MTGIMRFVEKVADWRVKIAAGLLGLIIIAGDIVGFLYKIVDPQTAQMTLISALGVLGGILTLNVGHSEHQIYIYRMKMEKEQKEKEKEKGGGAYEYKI